MFPVELIEAVEYLQSRVTASRGHGDGRVNSIKDEDLIINELIAKYGDAVEKSPDRCWHDVTLFKYKVNIKSSSMAGADNCNATKALLYCFTDAQLKSGWKHFYTSLQSVIDTGRNYYFIVLDKNTGKVYLQSLLTLARLTPNGNNLPFQIVWKDNIVPVQRTFQEAYNFLIGVFKESVKKRLEVHAEYENL